MIAVTTTAGTLVVDLATGDSTELRDVRNPSSLSPDGGRLIALDRYGVSVWDVALRRVVAPPDHPTPTVTATTVTATTVTATTWSADGASFAIADDSGAIVVWDARTLAVIRTLATGGAAATALRFDGDGATLYAAGRDGLMAWDLAGGRGVGSRVATANGLGLTTLACALAGRELTTEEWGQYLPGQPYRHVCPS